MSNLLELREKLMQDKADLDKKIKENERDLELQFRKMKEEREKLLETKRKNSDIKNFPLLFKLYSKHFGGPITYLGAYEDIYFYDFIDNNIVIKRNYWGSLYLDNVIDLSYYFEKNESKINEDFNLTICNILNSIVTDLIDKYNPSSWEELVVIARHTVRGPNFYSDLANQFSNATLKKKM